jgi:hypothetical protein
MVFAAAWAAVCIGAVQLAGMLPISAAPEAVRSPAGITLVALNAVLLLGLFVTTFVYSYSELRWSSAVVVGGAIFLFAPFAIQDLPETIKNGLAGLVILLALLASAFGLLLASGAFAAIST